RGPPRRTPPRVTFGAIRLSSSSHFALMPNSYRAKPVTLPPGRTKLSTKPAPTGSTTNTNTTGTERVMGWSAAILGKPEARMASGVSATNSSAYLRKSSALPPAAVVDPHVAAFVPTQLLQFLHEHPKPR